MKEQIKIQGMHCNSCVMLLTDVLTELPGVESVEVTMGKADISFDQHKVSKQQIKAAIEAEGYKVE